VAVISSLDEFPDYQRNLTSSRAVLIAEGRCDAAVQSVAGHEYANLAINKAIACDDEAPSQHVVETVALETLRAR
jgi:hypothetical protein